MRNGLIVLGLLLAAAAAAFLFTREEEPPSATQAAAPATAPVEPPAATVTTRPGREDFVGSQTCASCHQAQAEAYLSSHHAKALVTPGSELAKTHFDGTQLITKQGGATKLTLREGKPVVTTPTPDSKSATFPIAYMSGVWPLEQYVVATERGKLQSLGVVWDSRSKDAGGNRWLHVYGKEGIAPSDPLFFTGAAQNWNHMCAECHSTWVERRYDVKDDSFDTRWAELSVGCEACHGPGAAHATSARAGKGVVVPLPAKLKQSDLWTPSATGSPTPHVQDGVEVEVCAPCHSRRAPIKEHFLASDPFLDSFEPELLLPGRYHADGQVEGEVYEWGSFLQSRMYQAGVRCSDCHEPHGGKLIAQDNNLCVRCHEATRFNVASHSHHAEGKAPLCIDCHMPPSTFMQIDERRDHSIRIPRPDHSVTFGTPNACNGCHDKESAAWARDQLAKWAPTLQTRPHFVEGLAKDRKGALDAPSALRKVAEDGATPAIARATALERLGQYPTAKTAQTLQSALRSPEPLVAYGAALGAAQLPPRQRTTLLLPALEHATRAVRMAAAKPLLGLPSSELPQAARPALDKAAAEVFASFEVSASRAETHVERSALELARGQLAEAQTSLERALRLQPCLAEAHLNLADLARQRGDEAGAERALRSAIGCNPQNAAAHHALGLWQVRARQPKESIVSLRRASELAPTDIRFSYVLAVALASGGDRDEAIRILEKTLALRPNDSNTLQALASYLQQAGEHGRAAELRRVLEALQRE